MKTVRAAVEADCRLVWEWATAPSVRLMSFNTGDIPWDDHVAWFAGKLHSNTFTFLIGEDSGQPVGAVRFELTDPLHADISVMVDPTRHGKGYGPELIRAGMAFLNATRGVQVIHAYIKPVNRASYRAFEKAGFHRAGTVRISGEDAFHYIIELQSDGPRIRTVREATAVTSSGSASLGSMSIGGRIIGPGHPTYIIAEMSANHNQNLEQAIDLIRAAHAAGADAVKLQTYTADTLTIDCRTPHFQVGAGTLWEGRNLYDLYKEAYTPWEWHPRLKEVANELGMDLFSTPFDDSAVEFLEKLDIPVFKIASFEVVDLALLRRVARTGKPVIMSVGMATLSEIEEAVTTLRAAGTSELVILKCISAYPAPANEMNLRTIPHLSEAFGVPVGLSDHTMGTAVPVVAVALGACVIEKHFTMSRSVKGPDSAFSLEPHEFKSMVEAVRTAEQALGRVSYGVSREEAKSRAFRRSLFVVKDVKAGEVFTRENVRSIRPGHGLHPRHLEEVLGQRARCDVARGTPMSLSHLGGTA